MRNVAGSRRMSLVNAANEATINLNIPKRMTSTAAPYYQIVQELRQSFPQPVSDRVHDAYFGHAIMQAIDQVDALKSETPVLGEQVVLDFASAREARLDDGPSSLENVTSRMVQYLTGCFIWGHPKAQIHVVGPPSIAGIIGGLLPSIYNPNLVSDEYSRHVALAEVEVAAMVAHLVGYKVESNDEAMDSSAGIFTFGGTGTLLYAAKIGIEKACPGSSRHGLPWDDDPAVGYPLIVCSDRATQLAGTRRRPRCEHPDASRKRHESVHARGRAPTAASKWPTNRVHRGHSRDHRRVWLG